MDRAALDVARELHIPCGGWCPAGRWAEDGTVDPVYPLRETPSGDPAQRTEWNVRDSDATLILIRSELAGGSALTRDCAERMGRPCLVLDLRRCEPTRVGIWLERIGARRLNVAGPRESEAPGVYQEARGFLLQALSPDTGSG